MTVLKRFAVYLFTVAALAAVTSSLQAGWVRERYLTAFERSDAERVAGSINRGEVTSMRNAQVVQEQGRFHVFAERFYPDEDTVTDGKSNRSEGVVRPVQRTLTGNLTPGNGGARGIRRHTVALTPGVRYTIELHSGSGATREVQEGNGRVRRALAGHFDPVLLVEDVNGGRLGFNDDIAWPRNCNSRVSITAPASGSVHIVVSSFRAGESGPYTVHIIQN